MKYPGEASSKLFHFERNMNFLPVIEYLCTKLGFDLLRCTLLPVEQILNSDRFDMSFVTKSKPFSIKLPRALRF